MSTRTIAVLTLLATSVTGHDEVPQLWSVQPGDPDNADRLYGNGDIINIVIGQPLKEVEKSADYPAGVTMPKTEVDKLVTFHDDTGEVIIIGTDYTAVWEPFNVLDKLVITVTDATGASAKLQSFQFSVRCKASDGHIVKLIGYSGGGTGECLPTDTDTDPEPGPVSATVNWGQGRPKIDSVVSSTTTADVPLAAGDTITVTFEAPTDEPDGGGLSGKAMVDALLQARNSSGAAQFFRRRAIRPRHSPHTPPSPRSSAATTTRPPCSPPTTAARGPTRPPLRSPS